jgi:hypothetical protein
MTGQVLSARAEFHASISSESHEDDHDDTTRMPSKARFDLSLGVLSSQCSTAPKEEDEESFDVSNLKGARFPKSKKLQQESNGTLPTVGSTMGSSEFGSFTQSYLCSASKRSSFGLSSVFESSKQGVMRSTGSSVASSEQRIPAQGQPQSSNASSSLPKQSLKYITPLEKIVQSPTNTTKSSSDRMLLPELPSSVSALVDRTRTVGVNVIDNFSSQITQETVTTEPSQSEEEPDEQHSSIPKIYDSGDDDYYSLLSRARSVELPTEEEKAAVSALSFLTPTAQTTAFLFSKKKDHTASNSEDEELVQILEGVPAIADKSASHLLDQLDKKIFDPISQSPLSQRIKGKIGGIRSRSSSPSQEPGAVGPSSSPNSQRLDRIRSPRRREIALQKQMGTSAPRLPPRLPPNFEAGRVKISTLANQLLKEQENMQLQQTTIENVTPSSQKEVLDDSTMRTVRTSNRSAPGRSRSCDGFPMASATPVTPSPIATQVVSLAGPLPIMAPPFVNSTPNPSTYGRQYIRSALHSTPNPSTYRRHSIRSTSASPIVNRRVMESPKSILRTSQGFKKNARKIQKASFGRFFPSHQPEEESKTVSKAVGITKTVVFVDLYDDKADSAPPVPPKRTRSSELEYIQLNLKQPERITSYSSDDELSMRSSKFSADTSRSTHTTSKRSDNSTMETNSLPPMLPKRKKSRDPLEEKPPGLLASHLSASSLRIAAPMKNAEATTINGSDMFSSAADNSKLGASTNSVTFKMRDDLVSVCSSQPPVLPTRKEFVQSAIQVIDEVVTNDAAAVKTHVEESNSFTYSSSSGELSFTVCSSEVDTSSSAVGTIRTEDEAPDQSYLVTPTRDNRFLAEGPPPLVSPSDTTECSSVASSYAESTISEASSKVQEQSMPVPKKSRNRLQEALLAGRQKLGQPTRSCSSFFAASSVGEVASTVESTISKSAPVESKQTVFRFIPTPPQIEIDSPSRSSHKSPLQAIEKKDTTPRPIARRVDSCSVASSAYEVESAVESIVESTSSKNTTVESKEMVFRFLPTPSQVESDEPSGSRHKSDLVATNGKDIAPQHKVRRGDACSTASSAFEVESTVESWVESTSSKSAAVDSKEKFLKSLPDVYAQMESQPSGSNIKIDMKAIDENITDPDTEVAVEDDCAPSEGNSTVSTDDNCAPPRGNYMVAIDDNCTPSREGPCRGHVDISTSVSSEASSVELKPMRLNIPIPQAPSDHNSTSNSSARSSFQTSSSSSEPERLSNTFFKGSDSYFDIPILPLVSPVSKNPLSSRHQKSSKSKSPASQASPRSSRKEGKVRMPSRSRSRDGERRSASIPRSLSRQKESSGPLARSLSQPRKMPHETKSPSKSKRRHLIPLLPPCPSSKSP